MGSKGTRAIVCCFLWNIFSCKKKPACRTAGLQRQATDRNYPDVWDPYRTSLSGDLVGCSGLPTQPLLILIVNLIATDNEFFVTRESPSSLQQSAINFVWHAWSRASLHLIRPPDIVRQKALSCTEELFFFFIPELASRRTQRGRPSNVFPRSGRRWIYNNWPIDLAHPSLIFTWGQTARKLASFSTSVNFEPSAFENAARYLTFWNNF